MAVDVKNGQKTGYFLDQKENRYASRRYAKDGDVLDCFCNSGGFSLNCATVAKSVTAVDVSQLALDNVTENAKLNGIENIKFFPADAGKFMVDLANNNEQIDAVIMDPARAGSDIPFLSSLVKLNPEKVVYVSCNPETLARDLMYLSKNGYKVKKIQPVDMFPHTDHVECVVLLKRHNELPKA
jgi:23S rRNA (uracil1939-C5)-methyltransferase